MSQKPCPTEFQSIEVRSFEPELLFEAVAGGGFDQKLLCGGLFHARLDRVVLPNSRLDRGNYNLPCIGHGSIPEGWVGIGMTDSPWRRPWINGIEVNHHQVQFYSEGCPIDYRCSINAPWFLLQVRRDYLQRTAIATFGRELEIPTHWMLNTDVPCQSGRALLDRVEWFFGIGVGIADGPKLLELAESKLIVTACRALFSGQPSIDGRTLKATERKLGLIRQLDHAFREELTKAFAMQELSNKTGLKVRNLGDAIQRIYGVSPRELFEVHRLHQIRRELIGLSQEVVSIGLLASKYGFTNASRFSNRYAKLFGEKPTETLRRTRKLAGL
jgi:AraC-like DNA-binding protein